MAISVSASVTGIDSGTAGISAVIALLARRDCLRASGDSGLFHDPVVNVVAFYLLPAEILIEPVSLMASP